MKKKFRKKDVDLLDKIQYGLLLVYVVLIYIFNGSEDYNILIYVPISVFMIIELGYILKYRTIRINKYILMMFFFTFFCFLTCIWAQYKDLAMSRSITLFLLTVSFIFIFNYCARTNKKVEDILKMLLTAGVIFMVYIIGFYGVNNLVTMLGSNIRFGEEINNVNAIGIELAMTAIIAIYFGMKGNKKYYLLVLIPIVLALSTASKKAIICITVGIILLILFKKREKSSLFDLIKKVVLPVCVLAAVLIIIQTNIFPSLTRRLDYYSNSFTGSGRVDNSTEERNKFIEYGFKSFLENPICGIGVGNSGIITMEADGWFTYLHNNYVELLVTTGIIGTIMYYYIFVSMLIFSIKNRKEEDATAVTTIFILCLLLDWGMVSYYSKITYIFILIGALFYFNSLKQSKMRVLIDSEVKTNA